MLLIFEFATTRSHARSSVSTSKVTSVSFRESLFDVMERDFSAALLVLLESSSRTNLKRYFDEHLQGGIWEDDTSRVAAIGHEAEDLLLIEQRAHALGEFVTYRQVIGHLRNRRVNRGRAQGQTKWLPVGEYFAAGCGI
jgi:hypothetical protein